MRNITRNAPWARRACALILALGFALTAFVGLAASDGGNRTRILVGALGYATAVPTDSGVWLTSRKAAPVPIGEREYVSLPLDVGSAVPVGEKIRITMTSDSLDLSTIDLGIVFATEGVHLLREVTVSQKRAKTSEATTDLVVDGQMLNRKAGISLLISAVRLKNGGKIEVSFARVNPTSLDANAVVRIGSYSIRKQGSGAAPVETAAGLTGMLKADIAYIISNADRELIRVVMDGGEVLGLAVREGAIVVGVEYDLDRKVYVSSITQKQVLTKDELFDIFNTLDFSFMRAPDEGKWLAQQDGYSWHKSFAF